MTFSGALNCVSYSTTTLTYCTSIGAVPGVKPWTWTTVLVFLASTISVKQWKALKCQTLGAAVHVIVLVWWLEIDHCLVTLSYLLCAFCFVSACTKFAHEFLPDAFERVVQLIFSFPSWFHTIWFYCSHAFHSFLSQITLCFSFGSKDKITVFTCLQSYRYSSFTLRAYLCWRHTVLLPMTNNRTRKERLSWSRIARLYARLRLSQVRTKTRFRHMHARFPRSKK